MNPVFQAIMTALHFEQRECPRCRRMQAVPKSRRRDTVICTNCDAPIPPATPSTRRG